MKKLGIAMSIIGGIVIFIALMIWMSPPSIPPKPSPFETEPATSELPTTFEPIAFSGSSDTTTSPFIVTTNEWIIEWSYIPDFEYSEYATFGFFIYPRGETAGYVEAMLFPGNTWGTTYSYTGPNEYYLKVICANVESWQITISPA